MYLECFVYSGKIEGSRALLSLRTTIQFFLYLEVRREYSATRGTFNSLLGDGKCRKTRSLVFNILITKLVQLLVVFITLAIKMQNE